MNYFGEEYTIPNCGAWTLLGRRRGSRGCDGDRAEILSASFAPSRFGIGHVISVLRGRTPIASLARSRSAQQYGLLSGHPQGELRDWIYHLTATGFWRRRAIIPDLRLTDSSRRVCAARRACASCRSRARAAEEIEGDDRVVGGRGRGAVRVAAEFPPGLAHRAASADIILGDRSLREVRACAAHARRAARGLRHRDKSWRIWGEDLGVLEWAAQPPLYGLRRVEGGDTEVGFRAWAMKAKERRHISILRSIMLIRSQSIPIAISRIYGRNQALLVQAVMKRTQSAFHRFHVRLSAREFANLRSQM